MKRGTIISTSKKKNLYTYLLLLPGLGFIFTFFAIPLFVMIARSFGLFAIGRGSAFTFEYYTTLFSSTYYIKSLLFTLYIGFASALTSLLIAIPFSIFMQKKFPGKSFISALNKAPVVIPSLIATFMIMTIIAPNGLLNVILMKIGVITEPLNLIQDGAGLGIIIVQMWKNVPFMVIIISAVMMGINASLFDAARNLRASRIQIIIHVIIPLSMPGITTAFLLTFIKAFGGFQIPALIGPVFKPTIPVMMQQEAMMNYNWGAASMLGTVITVVAFIIMHLYILIVEKDQLN